MKNVLMFVTILAIVAVSGSLSYYYLVVLPQQNTKSQQDISAIRNVIAPTPAQEQAQEEQGAQSEAEAETEEDNYLTCLTTMGQKASDYVQNLCPINPNDTTSVFHPFGIERDQCITNAENSATYKAFDCARP